MVCDCGLYESGEHVIACEAVLTDEAHEAAVGTHPRLEAERDAPPLPSWGADDDAALDELLGNG